VNDKKWWALKSNDLLQKVKEHIEKGTYIISTHALERQNLRGIALQQVLYVLKNGIREEAKELFDVSRQMWKYAIRGKTLDGINLRVIIAFEGEMIIITVMRVK